MEVHEELVIVLLADLGLEHGLLLALHKLVHILLDVEDLEVDTMTWMFLRAELHPSGGN